MAHGSVKWLHESGKDPIFTLMPPGSTRRARRNHYRVVTFTDQEAARIDARCRQFNAGFGAVISISRLRSARCMSSRSAAAIKPPLI